MALIECVGLRREYEMISETVVALDDVDLTIEKGELVMLLGPSGSGKTTLLNIISALDSPDAGEYRFDGAPVPASKSEAMTTFRRENVGYIFQFFNLLGDLTVLENVMLVQEISGKKDAAAARQALEAVGLAGMENRFPSELSGGQQQRVAIARSLAKKPRLLLGDEPTGNLDTQTSAEVMTVLSDACRREGITAIIVTHDPAMMKYATRVLRIDSGRIVSDEVGSAGTVLGKATNQVKDAAEVAVSAVSGAAKKVVSSAQTVANSPAGAAIAGAAGAALQVADSLESTADKVLDAADRTVNNVATHITAKVDELISGEEDEA